jgi:three-Cys-motif partner protein
MDDSKFDKVGSWTEVKLHILREYSEAYATILNKQKSIKYYAYIDGFAGAGTHISKKTGQPIEGSPSIALKTKPSFSQYHFIDLNGERITLLRNLAKNHNNVSVYQGDCNEVLLKKVFPQCQYEQFRRALCILDPYDLNPSWEVIFTAGHMKSIEIFLNFMIMDANMNVLKKNPDKVTTNQIKRMNKFWGDDSWQHDAYKTEMGLFGPIEEKVPNEGIIKAYQKRLKTVAGFKFVPEPIPMYNSTGAVVYYLFFASHNETGNKIATAIFKKYREKGGINVG